ncbi:hypothetical protein GCM10007415_26080 [Parapedobacter pyrenivorans]|uniref:Uncharacterized protein n=1 Tax=Parapedobacter pyrenivorans TaxID=1305674 RepID=A0A917HV67_9SPHI|nr:hypothetical protein GCM10007415_26080 [Parapedobacter pyrenivorans]
MNYTKQKYYVSVGINGDYEVHHEHCTVIPALDTCKLLGEYYSCIVAVAEAIKIYPIANGCKTCSPKCHIG